MENGRPCASFVFAMFRKNVDSFGQSVAQQGLEELQVDNLNKMDNSEANLNMRMVAWRRSNLKMMPVNHRSRTTRRRTDGMLAA